MFGVKKIDPEGFGDFGEGRGDKGRARQQGNSTDKRLGVGLLYDTCASRKVESRREESRRARGRSSNLERHHKAHPPVERRRGTKEGTRRISDLGEGGCQGLGVYQRKEKTTTKSKIGGR